MRFRFIRDPFTTLIDLKWRFTVVLFCSILIGCWLIFTLIWWLIAFTHGDLEDDHLPDKQADTKWIPCVLQIWGFPSCFLFSLETQHTTGYGGRATTEQCPEAIFIMVMQCIIGMIIECFIGGAIFAKMILPKQRAQTILFSRKATVCLHDGNLCITFRMGDLCKSHIIGAGLRAILIHKKISEEGELIKYFQTELNVTIDDCDDLLFIWPIIVRHVIDKDSPFYYLRAKDLRSHKFEIVVILDGTIESTSISTQARTSYLNTEILWGYRFKEIINYDPKRYDYRVDYSKFDDIVEVDTPKCSAADLDEINDSSSVSDDVQLTTWFDNEASLNEPLMLL